MPPTLYTVKIHWEGAEKKALLLLVLGLWLAPQDLWDPLAVSQISFSLNDLEHVLFGASF